MDVRRHTTRQQVGSLHSNMDTPMRKCLSPAGEVTKGFSKAMVFQIHRRISIETDKGRDSVRRVGGLYFLAGKHVTSQLKFLHGTHRKKFQILAMFPS